MELTTISAKPIVKRSIERGAALRFVEERQFDSDSGYDGNIKQRVQQMAAGALALFFGKEGNLLSDTFPTFDIGNRLRVTVELLPPEGAAKRFDFMESKPPIGTPQVVPIKVSGAEDMPSTLPPEEVSGATEHMRGVETDPLKEKTNAELRAMLDAKGIEYGPRDPKDALIAKLSA